MIIRGLDLSPIEFAQMHNERGALLGSEFLGWPLERIEAELKMLTDDSPIPGKTGAQLRAGGEQRVKRLTLVAGYLKHNGLQVWTHSVPENSFTKAMTASMAREDRQLGKLPDRLQAAIEKYDGALVSIDLHGDFLQDAIVQAEAAGRELLTEADKAGVSDKDLRRALEGDALRLAIRKRFSDGAGAGSMRVAVGTSIMTAAGALASIVNRFKRPQSGKSVAQRKADDRPAA